MTSDSIYVSPTKLMKSDLPDLLHFARRAYPIYGKDIPAMDHARNVACPAMEQVYAAALDHH